MKRRLLKFRFLLPISYIPVNILLMLIMMGLSSINPTLSNVLFVILFYQLTAFLAIPANLPSILHYENTFMPISISIFIVSYILEPILLFTVLFFIGYGIDLLISKKK